MKIIDSDNYAEHGIETMVFAGGEPHVKVPIFDESVLLFLKCRTWLDTGFAALVMDALKRQPISMTAFLPYFPGARQDRSDGSCGLSAAVIGNLFDDVYVFDIHSEAAFNSANIIYSFMPCDLPITKQVDVVGVIAPDKGAKDRAESYRNRFYPFAELIQCEKTRNSQTGALSGYAMPPLKKQGRYVIVDDICDGGGTFNLLAAAFARDPVGRYCPLELFVSHGIFSKGIDAISPSISKITTTDSWCQLPNSDRLTVLPLNALFPNILGE